MLLAIDQLLHAKQMIGRSAFRLQALEHTQQQHGALGEHALGIGVQRLCQVAIVGVYLGQSALALRPDLPAGGGQHRDKTTSSRQAASWASRLAARTLHTH